MGVIAICNTLIFLLELAYKGHADEVFGCGGFLKSHVPIDYAKVEIRLVTKQGIIKDRTNCAPNNGYYFLPLYDKGEFTLELSPPPGWSFTPKEVNLNIDGTDSCSLGKDINFIFDGFGITGTVESLGTAVGGPEGVTVSLHSKEDIRATETNNEGKFFFSPVYPGTYTVSISHPRWKIFKKTIEVKVSERNADLPPKSLIVHGYSVTGRIQTAEGYPVKDVSVILFSKNQVGNDVVENCDKTKLSSFINNDKFLCHVTSNTKGEFIFPIVSSGSYFVALFFRERNIYFLPEIIEFEVGHNDVNLPQPFQIIGFSVIGRVLDGKRRPISNAKIILNGLEITRSNDTGRYKLEKLTEGSYRLKAETGELIFDEISLDINTNTQTLPDLLPSAYKVCGKVISDKRHTVIFKQVGSTSHLEAETSDNQQFCQHLPQGKYELQVKITDEDNKNGLMFFPVTHIIEVQSENIADLVFSQLKCKISGKVNCFVEKDCTDINVIFKTNFEEVVVPFKDSEFVVHEMHPGIYEVTLTQNKLCWKTNKYTVNVNSVITEVPEFVQTGYVVNFVSSHDVKVNYKTKSGKTNEINVIPGITSACLESPGEYTLELLSCHIFTSNTILYNTLSKNNQITLTAVKHTSVVYFQSDLNYGPIQLNIKFGGSKTRQTINFADGRYKLELLLKPSEVATITPTSDSLVFFPPSIQIEGTNDCQTFDNKISISKGKVITGKIIPPLKDVLITVKELPNGEILSSNTNENGVYEFPPLDSKNMYKVTALKDSYIITGPDHEGNFKAQKLAEIIVEVLDTNKKPLSGVLLSLSGGDNYRKNLQTDPSGRISFHSLGAGDYFLRPMMKEYQFEPTSKIINVEEGKTVSVQMTGKRVAFSAFGRVSTLNDEPVKDINVVASGINSCSANEEETTTDVSGNFRIRGLRPSCSFRVHIQVTNKYDHLVERTAPHYIEIQNVTEDIKDLHFTVFHPMTILDVMIKVYAKNTDHYRSLKLQVLREDEEINDIFSIDIEDHIKSAKDKKRGVLLHLPTMQTDGKTYSLQLEHAYIKNKSPVKYLVANSSFKYIELDYVINSNRIEQQPIKQTSVWFVVFFLLVLLSALRVHSILDFIKDHININLVLESLGKFIPNKKKVEGFDQDIDQIVQDINNIRKKSKKM